MNVRVLRPARRAGWAALASLLTTTVKTVVADVVLACMIARERTLRSRSERIGNTRAARQRSEGALVTFEVTGTRQQRT
jgi:hypothetical protein